MFQVLKTVGAIYLLKLQLQDRQFWYFVQNIIAALLVWCSWKYLWIVYSMCSIHQIDIEDVVKSILPLASSHGFQLATPFPRWHRRGLPVLEGCKQMICSYNILVVISCFLAVVSRMYYELNPCCIIALQLIICSGLTQLRTKKAFSQLCLSGKIEPRSNHPRSLIEPLLILLILFLKSQEGNKRKRHLNKKKGRTTMPARFRGMFKTWLYCKSSLLGVSNGLKSPMDHPEAMVLDRFQGDP